MRKKEKKDLTQRAQRKKIRRKTQERGTQERRISHSADSVRNEDMKARSLLTALRCRWEDRKERSRAWESISRLIRTSGTRGWTGKTTRRERTAVIGWSMLEGRCGSTWADARGERR